jgi:glutathione S-transferase
MGIARYIRISGREISRQSAVATVERGTRHGTCGGKRDACRIHGPAECLPDEFEAAVKNNVRRIETLWEECRKTYGKGGPFLFGKFSIADAMYAPVVTRFDTYALKVGSGARDYMDAVIGTEAFRAWKADALQETWIIQADEAE